MSAQLEQHQPRATHLRAVPPASTRAPEHASAALPNPAQPDPDRGLSLLMSFVGAVAVMVADVVVIGAVAESWILIPGFAVLAAMTVIVFSVIMRLLGDSGEKAARRRGRPADREGARS
jgi:hypothetical protein